MLDWYCLFSIPSEYLIIKISQLLIPIKFGYLRMFLISIPLGFHTIQTYYQMQFRKNSSNAHKSSYCLEMSTIYEYLNGVTMFRFTDGFFDTHVLMSIIETVHSLAYRLVQHPLARKMPNLSQLPQEQRLLVAYVPCLFLFRFLFSFLSFPCRPMRARHVCGRGSLAGKAASQPNDASSKDGCPDSNICYQAFNGWAYLRG